MLRIALGSDQRGGKAAEEIVTKVLFCERYTSAPGEVFRSISITSSQTVPNANEISDEPSDIISHRDIVANYVDPSSGHETPTPWSGAVLITCEKKEDNDNFSGVDMERIEVTMLPYHSEGGDHGNRIDYPDIAAAVARKVSRGEAEYGILVSGIGTGMSIVANKFPGVRAASCHNDLTTELARKHNNANVLCVSGEMLGIGGAADMVRRFLSTDYDPKCDGGRHQRRVQQICDLEKVTGL